MSRTSRHGQAGRGGDSGLREIKLYGALGRFAERAVGQRIFRAVVATPAEAVRFLVANIPGIEEHIRPNTYRVSVGRRHHGEDELHDPQPAGAAICFVPVAVGASGAWKVVVGALLVVASFIVPGLGVLGPILFSVGASLALSGVAQLLAPTPKIPKIEEDPRQEGYSFSGIQQTSRPGVPVPIVYGEAVVGSVVVSAGIEAT